MHKKKCNSRKYERLLTAAHKKVKGIYKRIELTVAQETIITAGTMPTIAATQLQTTSLEYKRV